MTGVRTAANVRDLAEQIQDFLAEHVADDAMSGFTVHRHLVDGTAAVTYRPGTVPAYTAVLRWTLTTWAGLLRGAGFTVEVDVHDDRDQKGVPQVLRVLGRSEVAPAPEPRRRPIHPQGDGAFPWLSRDIAEQVIRQSEPGFTYAALIDAALDERGLSGVDTATRELLHAAVLDAVGAIAPSLFLQESS